MTDHPVEFQWDVHEGGHQWINTTTADPQSKRGLFLTDSRPLGAGGFAVKRFNPLHRYSGLFRNFAATPPTTNGIRAFADKFGMLGGDASTMIVLPDRWSNKPGSL